VSIFYLVLPLALLLVLAAVLAFVWAARRGQFDDLETPALRILPDDEAAGKPSRRADHPATPRSSRGA
jgi:cbb3-type cytochrome oxidase maturation protein